MKESVFQQPSSQDLAGFREGDPLAMDRVLVLMIPQLLRWAWRSYPDLPVDDVEELVYAALAETCRNHSRYDPAASLFTTYVINLIRWRMDRLRKSVERVSNPPENLRSRVYHSMDEREIGIGLSRERFFTEVRKRLKGLDLEFFELMLKRANPQAYLTAVERHDQFADPQKEAKNRRARVQRKLKEIATEIGYTSSDLLKE